jgi:predicted metalloendopeptidase
LKIAGEFTRNINTSVDPCEDFYHYACDGWIKDNPIPPSENEQATFFKLGKATSESLRSLLEAATDLEPGSPVRKARDYYTSCMDEREVERTAKTQIKGIIQRVGSWSLGTNSTGWNASSWSWKEALLKIHKELNVDKSPLFALEVVEDPKNSKRYLIKVNDYTVLRSLNITMNYAINDELIL